MDTPTHSGEFPTGDHLDTEGVIRRRIAWEADRIAEAPASVAAGRVVSSRDVDAWIDSLDADHELPPPQPR